MTNTEASKIIEILRQLSEDERKAVLAEVFDRFCNVCARDLRPGENCQCWNDE